MKKITVLLMMFSLAVSADEYLYFDASSLFPSTNNQNVLISAIEKTLSIVEVSYLLEDKQTNERFGRDRKPYFSKIPFVGISIDNGIVISSDVLSPWNTDREFNQYKNDYKPILYCVERMMATDTVRTAVDTSKIKMQDIGESCVLWKHNNMKGLCTDTVCGEKTGWLVLVAYDEQNKTKPYSIQFVRRNISAEKGQRSAVEMPEFERDYIGGAFITLDYAEVGVVRLQLFGIITSMDKKTAYIEAPKIENKHSKLNKLNKL